MKQRCNICKNILRRDVLTNAIHCPVCRGNEENARRERMTEEEITHEIVADVVKEESKKLR